MRKNNLNIYLTALLLATLIFSLLTIYAFGEHHSSALSMSASSAALYIPENDSFVLLKDADKRMPMASTTKIMTALVALEECKMSEIVMVDDSAIGVEGSSAYLRQGDIVTMEELIYALLLGSANDAAVAIACHISGSVDDFSLLMNKKAMEMGLQDTHFANPHGLDDEEHYTTARDLAIIAARALENSEFKKIASTYKKSFITEDRSRTYVNHNKLLKMYDGCIGVKTGFTKRSGRCLVSAAERDGLTFIAVTLDAPNDWSDHKKMLDFGFEAYEKRIFAERMEKVYKVPVVDGEKDFVVVTNDEEASIITERREYTTEEHMKLIRFAVAPVKRGDILGEIVYTVDGDEVARLKLVATEGVEKKESKGFFDKLFN